MREMIIPLICWALVVSAQSQAAASDSDPSPLHLKFRVLSSLPWKVPGATRKMVLERIFSEPDILARGEVLREYLHTALPVEEFPAAFDECMALEQADFPDATAEFLIRAWAERDPAGAINRCLTLFDLVIEGAPLQVDAWKKPIRISNLEKARASNYWFGTRGVVHACWKGLAAAALRPERRKELESQFRGAYLRRFGAQLPARIEDPYKAWVRRYRSSYGEHPDTTSSDAQLRAEFIRMLTAAPEEIPGMLKWPAEPPSDITFPRALIHWMNGDASAAQKIVERILDYYDPRQFYRGDSALMDMIPAEFLVEWAILDRAGFMAWAETQGGSRAQAVYLAVMPKGNKTELGEMNSKAQQWHHEGPPSTFDKLWLALDPGHAVPWQYRYGDSYNVEDSLDDLRRSSPPANFWRDTIAMYASSTLMVDANKTWGVAAVWARVDLAAMIKQCGLPWCLRSGNYNRSQLARMLSNQQALENDTDLRNTFSALRTWALLRPEKMREWIEDEKFTPDMRDALLWLLDNAAGGAP
jgi:hypothetical protein